MRIGNHRHKIDIRLLSLLDIENPVYSPTANNAVTYLHCHATIADHTPVEYSFIDCQTIDVGIVFFNNLVIGAIFFHFGNCPVEIGNDT